jgi:hypothetical protein
VHKKAPLVHTSGALVSLKTVYPEVAIPMALGG